MFINISMEAYQSITTPAHTHTLQQTMVCASARSLLLYLGFVNVMVIYKYAVSANIPSTAYSHVSPCFLLPLLFAFCYHKNRYRQRQMARRGWLTIVVQRGRASGFVCTDTHIC